MAFVECRESFETIKNSTRLSLLLPEEGAARAVLYLLPVRRGFSTDWVRYTGVELWARKWKLAVVMPEGLSSDFCNMRYGMRWWDYLTEELPQYLTSVLGRPSDRRLCFGAQMGALASLKLGLLQPGRFAAVGAVGEDFRRVSRYATGHSVCADMESIYGERPVPDNLLDMSDPLRIAARCEKEGAALFLSRRDGGTGAIADACRRPVRWFAHEGEGWDGYGECLKEFLQCTLGKEANA